MTNSFTDPIQDDALQDLAAQDTPASVTTLPNDGVGVETASALLATVTLANKAELTDANRTQILQAFESGGFIRMDGEVADPAPSAVVIVTGEPATDSDATARNTAFLAVVKQFDTVAAQMVLAAPTAAGTGNPVAAVRGDSSLAKSVSTVDGVSFAEGQVATAMALAEQFTGQVGHYGTGKKATARIPTLH
jgi:hypothetical protein